MKSNLAYHRLIVPLKLFSLGIITKISFEQIQIQHLMAH